MRVLAKSDVLAILAFSISSLVFRVLLYLDKSIVPTIIDSFGFATDFAFSAFLGLIALGLFKHLKWLSYTMLFLWTLLGYSAFEYTRVFDSVLDLHFVSFLADPTFFRGSASSISAPLTLGFCILAGFFAFHISSKQAEPKSLKIKILISMSILILLSVLVPENGMQFASWRTENTLVYSISSGFKSGHSQKSEFGAESEWQKEIFGRDLSGNPIVDLPKGSKPNILLVLSEGVSGAFLPSLRLKHKLDDRNDVLSMKNLDRIFQENLHYSNFIVPQRQTDRGEYSILCGDYAKLDAKQPKMLDRVISGGPPCLPEVLKKSGYKTVYLQAADLEFMQKNSFMPGAGFEESYGDKWFSEGAIRNEWGWDDRTFFRQSLKMIHRLNEESRPWFLVLLTVGTHHPFLIPDGYLAESDLSSRQKAFMYLDEALGDFYTSLTDEKLLDNTVVFFTSDESAGFEKGYDDFTRVLSQNLGFMAVALPGTHEPLLIDRPFVQADISMSILDLLGLSEKAPHFLGRSIFRDNDSKRPLVFANSYVRSWFLRSENDELTFCKGSWDQCYSAQMNKGMFFGLASNSIMKADPKRVAQLKQAVKISGGPENKEAVKLKKSFCKGCRFEINPGRKSNILFESPNIHINDDSAFVDIRLNTRKLEGQGKAKVILTLLGVDTQQSFSAELSRYKSVKTELFKFNSILFSDQLKIVLQLAKTDADLIWEMDDIEVDIVIGQATPVLQKQYLDKFAPLCDRHRPPGSLDMQPLIAHAGGRIKGIDYSNSLEAMNRSYSRGLRWFEVDISSTSDNQLVLLHDWDKTFKRLFTVDPARRSMAQFKKLKMIEGLTQMTFEDLAKWMKSHPLAKIVSDVKEDNISVLTLIAAKYPELRARIIPQIYNSQQYCPVRALGYDHVIFTVYRSALPDEVILQIARRYPFTALTIPESRSATGDFQKVLKQTGTPMYTHTINDSEKALQHRKNGTFGFYTDELSEL